MVAAAVLPIVLALAAIFAQPTPPPADFIAGALAGSARVDPGAFVGMVWPCGDETCYAGVRWRDGRPTLATGT